MTGDTVIVDGATNETAQVDGQRRLRTRATTVSNALNASINSDQYNIDTEVLTLTDATDSALLWVRNRENEKINWSVPLLVITLGSSDGTGDLLLKFYKNDGSSDIELTGTDPRIFSFNLGSVKPLVVDAKQGGTGKSFSVSEFTDVLIDSAPTGVAIPLDSIIIEPGSSLGVSIVPPSGNTSMKVQASFSIIRLKED